MRRLTKQKAHLDAHFRLDDLQVRFVDLHLDLDCALLTVSLGTNFYQCCFELPVGVGIQHHGRGGTHRDLCDIRLIDVDFSANVFSVSQLSDVSGTTSCLDLTSKIDSVPQFTELFQHNSLD